MHRFATLRSLLATLGLAWLMACVLATAAHAQAAPAPGSIVRLTIRESDSVRIERGTLLSLGDATIELRRPGEPELLRVARDSVSRIEQRQGSQWRKGLLIGFLAGAVTGGVIGFADGDDEEGFIAFSAEEKALAGGALLGAVGGVIGLVFGATQDRWITIDDRMRVGVLPVTLRRVALAGTLSF